MHKYAKGDCIIELIVRFVIAISFSNVVIVNSLIGTKTIILMKEVSARF